MYFIHVSVRQCLFHESRCLIISPEFGQDLRLCTHRCKNGTATKSYGCICPEQGFIKVCIAFHTPVGSLIPCFPLKTFAISQFIPEQRELRGNVIDLDLEWYH